MKIFIAIITKKYSFNFHNVNFYAAKTMLRLINQLASYVREQWDEELPNIPMPEDEQEQIDTYFENVDYEFLEFSGSTEVYEP